MHIPKYGIPYVRLAPQDSNLGEQYLLPVSDKFDTSQAV